MPIIALPRPQAVTALPGLALDRESRGQVDTRGVQSALLQFNESNKLPQMDPKAMAAPYEALGSVGRAIAQAGSVIGAAALKEKESVVIRQQGDAQVKWTNALAEIDSKLEAAKHTPELWKSIASEDLTRLRSQIESDKTLLPEARESISLRFAQQEADYLRGIGTSAQKANHMLAHDSIATELKLAVSRQDKAKFEQIVSSAPYRERFFPHETTVWQETFRLEGERQGNDLAENQFRSAVLLGDEKMLDQAIQTGKQRGGWTDDFITAKRLDGAKGIERTREVNKSRSEAEFLGNVMMRKAQGETFVPAQVESWVKENRIDKDTGARLMVALKSELGAMQGEFYDFLSTTVDAYDPKTDPDGRKAHEIRIQAFHMGLNQIQMGYFHNRLDHAAKLNGPQRAEQAVLSAGKKVIGDLLKDVGKTRSWDSDAETLLKDPAKLEAYGIPAERAKEINTLISGTKGGWFSESKEADKAKALSLFRQQAATRVPDKPAGLTKAEWNKMNALAEGDDTQDPNAKISAEFDRAVLEEGLEAWYNYERNKRGTPPTDREVKDWVGRETRAALQGGNLGTLFGISDQAASSGSGLDEGTVGLVKGFEGFTPNAYGDFKQTSVGYGTRARFEGETLTEREADTRLREELTMHAKRVDALTQKYGTKLSPEQRGALVSFDFNTGAVHRLFERAGSDTTQWPAIMREFKKAGGKDVAGLITRRGKEASFFE